jgi:hypothetical protein
MNESRKSIGGASWLLGAVAYYAAVVGLMGLPVGLVVGPHVLIAAIGHLVLAVALIGLCRRIDSRARVNR